MFTPEELAAGPVYGVEVPLDAAGVVLEEKHPGCTGEGRIFIRQATQGLFAADITLGDDTKVTPARIWAVPNVQAHSGSPVPWDTDHIWPWVVHVDIMAPVIGGETRGWTTITFAVPSLGPPGSALWASAERFAVQRAGAHEAMEGFELDPHGTGDAMAWMTPTGRIVSRDQAAALERENDALHAELDLVRKNLETSLRRTPDPSRTTEQLALDVETHVWFNESNLGRQLTQEQLDQLRKGPLSPIELADCYRLFDAICPEWRTRFESAPSIVDALLPLVESARAAEDDLRGRCGL